MFLLENYIVSGMSPGQRHLWCFLDRPTVNTRIVLLDSWVRVIHNQIDFRMPVIAFNYVNGTTLDYAL